MKKKKFRIWGTILISLGVIMLLSFIILEYFCNHDSTGLVGGGIGLVIAGISLLQAGNRKKE